MRVGSSPELSGAIEFYDPIRPIPPSRDSGGYRGSSRGHHLARDKPDATKAQLGLVHCVRHQLQGLMEDGVAISITTEDPGQPEIEQLLRNGEAFAAALYPAESNHFLSVDELRKDNVKFLVARTSEGNAVGTAAVAINDGWAELKRMWVEPEARGQGLARHLLRRIEAEAVDAGVTVLRLETGVDSREALGLYSASGFKVIAPFGTYRPDPLSVFMEKTLAIS